MAYFEKIEDYVTDKLNPVERADFEAQLNSNSQLKHEVDVQRDIINAIKSSRHAQLKSNLSQIPVGSAASGGVSPWWFVAASSVLVVGAFSYYWLTGSSSDIVSPSIQKNVAVEKSIPITTTIPTIGTDKTVVKEESLVVVETTDKEVPKSSASKVVTKSASKEVVSTLQSPDIDMPDADIMSSEIGNTTPIIRNDVVVPSNQTLVEINDTDKSKFHYRTTNSKVILYGDFKKSPYELIEIHASSGNLLYLKFDKQYYSIQKNQQKQTRLNAIQDKALLLKLSKVNNK